MNFFRKLIELVNKYNAAFENWSGDVDTHKNKGSDLIDSDHQEIQVIKGEISEDAVDISTEGLVRIDIKETDVENFKTRLQNTIDLLQSYRETIESVRYRGTTIIGEDVVEKPLTGDTGINTFDRFESAATSQKNGCTAPVVEKAKISVYHDTKGEDKGIDEYIEETWEITDGLDTLVETTHDNSPKLHDYDHWKDTETPDIDSFDAWLHNKFDLIEIASDQLDGVMSRLKDMIKGFADSALADFGTYTNPYLSAKKYADIANLPSNGASDPIKEDATGKDVSKDEDDVTKDLDSSSSVSGLFDNLSFEFHLEDVRDKLYTMEYVMRMFTYETQALEYVYNQAREGMPEDDIYQVKKSDGTTMDITPGNAENLYKPYLDEGGAWWTDEEKTLTYNKSMTNKLFNYENNYSFGNEVEYIMFGGDIDSSKTKIGATLYFIRYALNLTPVMAKYWPNDNVTQIAGAISGATAGVIPIPLIKAVICLGICAAEAAVDVNYLKAGLPVLFVKGKDELFILLELDRTTFPDAVKNGASYGGKAFSKNSVKIGKKSSDSSAGLTFSYSDYLRIFLYIQLCAAEDNAYLRIADVIQANMTSNVNLTEHVDNFEMSKAITYFNIDATVRVKPLMLTLPYAKNYGSDTVLNTDAWNTIRQKMTRGY